MQTRSVRGLIRVRRRGAGRRPGWLRRRACTEARRASRSRWSRSGGSAACASTRAASRRRSCSRPPRCCAPSAERRRLRRRWSASRPSSSPPRKARKQEVVDKLTKGVEGLLKQRGRRHDPRRAAPWPTPPATGRRRRRHRGRGQARSSSRRARSPARSRVSSSTACACSASEHVLQLQSVPPRALVVGGGAIGCEFASMLADFGTEVTVVEMLPRLLPGADEQVSEFLARRFKRRGITVHTDSRLTSIDGARRAHRRVRGTVGRHVAHRRPDHREHRARAAHRRRRVRRHRARVVGPRPRRRPHAHERAGRVRGRRRRADAAARARRASPRRSSRSRRSSART